MHKGHFPATMAMNKTSINMMIGRQERFVGSLDKKVQDYGEKKKKWKEQRRQAEVRIIGVVYNRYDAL